MNRVQNGKGFVHLPRTTTDSPACLAKRDRNNPVGPPPTTTTSNMRSSGGVSAMDPMTLLIARVDRDISAIFHDSKSGAYSISALFNVTLVSGKGSEPVDIKSG